MNTKLVNALRALLDRANGQDIETLAQVWDDARAALAAYDATPAPGAHTSELWAISVADETRIMGDGYVVATCERGPLASHDFAGRDNARRIVACVNACAGMDTARLESEFAGGELANCALLWVGDDT